MTSIGTHQALTRVDARLRVCAFGDGAQVSALVFAHVDVSPVAVLDLFKLALRAIDNEACAERRSPNESGADMAAWTRKAMRITSLAPDV